MRRCFMFVCCFLALGAVAHTIDIQDLPRLFVHDYMNAKESPFFPLSDEELTDILVRGTAAFCEDLRTNSTPESVCKAVRNLTDLHHNISFVRGNSAWTNRVPATEERMDVVFETRVKACVALYEKIDWNAPYERQERKPFLKYKGKTYYSGFAEFEEDPVVKAKLLELLDKYEEEDFRRHVQWLLRDKLKYYQDIIQMGLSDLKHTDPKTFAEFSKIIEKNVKSEPLKRKLYENYANMPFFFVPFNEGEKNTKSPVIPQSR
ncbi:MAG: hypothetical protein IJR99_11095 [Kiritimatiellae bacterium]|nr:hypothetical protein [Kiritimatiellia bacterium]